MQSLCTRRLPYAVSDVEDFDDEYDRNDDEVVGDEDYDDGDVDGTGNTDDDVDRSDCLLAAYSIFCFSFSFCLSFSFTFSFQFTFIPTRHLSHQSKLSLQYQVELLTPI